VLIWIDGAFGVGKTTVAKALARRWPAALSFDPEQLGFLLRRSGPPDLRTRDFQEMPLWRQLVRQTAAGLIEHYGRPLIVPMALPDPRCRDEIVGELQRSGLDVRHFLLLASESTLRRRLFWRWSLPASRRWARAQIGRSPRPACPPDLATCLQTDRRRVRDIVADLIATLPNPLPTTASIGTDAMRPIASTGQPPTAHDG
jgi:predicted kinase